MTPSSVLSLCALAGIVLVAAAVPLYRRRVPPNYFYGVRLRSTLHDEALWYDVNARAGRDLIIVGVVFLLALGVAQVVGRAWVPAFRILAPLLLLVVGLAIETMVIMRVARRLKAGHHASP